MGKEQGPVVLISQVPTGSTAEWLQSSASVQMWSEEHDPWSLMWLWGLRRRGGSKRSTTSNHWFGWNADSEVVNVTLLLSLTVGIGVGRMICIQVPFTEMKCTKKIWIIESALKVKVDLTAVGGSLLCCDHTVGCGSRDMSYLHLMPFIASYLYI